MKETNKSIKFTLNDLPIAEAHCDGPCGVYDPSSARIAAEAVRSMTKKILDLTPTRTRRCSSSCSLSQYCRTICNDKRRAGRTRKARTVGIVDRLL